MRWIVRKVAFRLELVRRLLILVAVLVALPHRGFLPGRPTTPSGTLYYTCRRWPACDIEADEYIPAHKFNRHDPPHCPKHLTTPMDKEVYKQ
jgi:hypothetical protein